MSLKVIEPDGSLSPAPRNLPTELFVDFERSDDQAIMAELQGAVVEEYVYSFKQGQSTVTGLSLPGVMAVAQRMGGITCGQPIWTVADDGVTCDISATDHKVGLTVWGTATALYDEYGKGGHDKFARAKALSKAQRNAIRKVIPETVATQMLKAFLAEKRGGNQPRQQTQQQRQVRQPESPRQIADATVVDGQVVTDDGEIVGQLQRQDGEPDSVLMGEFTRRLANADDLDELKAVSEWAARVDLVQAPAVAAYKARKRELRAAAKPDADVEQPELIEV